MLKLATTNEIDIIMKIITDAKTYLRQQGLSQWNLADGYPKKEDMLKDIENGNCYLYIENEEIIGCVSILFTPDENYIEIDGKWLSNDQYASIHRIAISNNNHNKNIGVKMLLAAEEIVKNNNCFSIKIDTHKNNIPMSKTIEKAGYRYCGIIKLKRSNIDNLRNAYEKRLA